MAMGRVAMGNGKLGGGNGEGEKMGRGATGRGDLKGTREEWEMNGQEEVGFHRWI